MATHYVLCPSCGRNHCSEGYWKNQSYKNELLEREDDDECRICKFTDAYRSRELRDYGKNHSDCRFLLPRRFDHYHRCIPGYGDAVDFDLRAHPWNCAGHSHCKHGALGLIEERAITTLRNENEKYILSSNHCKCRKAPHCCNLYPGYQQFKF